MYGLGAALLHILWPRSCPVCGRLAVSVCRSCLESVPADSAAKCMECGMPEPCILHESAVYCVSAARYDDVSRRMIHAMKYRGQSEIAWMLGREMARRTEPPPADILVPVPLHKGSDRGYNQAELIARGAGEVWDIPVALPLRWSRIIQRQAISHGTGARKLEKNVIISDRIDPDHGYVCLIDDVSTSGSTLRAAREAVEEAGGTVVGARVWSIP